MFYDPKKGHNLPYDPFKAIISPRPIGWISSRDPFGNINLAPYSFFNAVADKPPMVIFSTTGQKNLEPTKKDSLSNIETTGEFVVNIVSFELTDKMNKTSGNFSNEEDEFEIANLTKASCQKVKSPRVEESPASLECELYKTIKLPGQHNTLVIGEVIGIHIMDKYMRDGVFCITDFSPVARLGYNDYTCIKKTFSLLRPK